MSRPSIDPAVFLETDDLIAQLRLVAEGAWRIPVSVSSAVATRAANELERLKGPT